MLEEGGEEEEVELVVTVSKQEVVSSELCEWLEKDSAAEKVLVALRERGPLARFVIAQVVGEEYRRLSNALNALLKLGLIEKTGIGVYAAAKTR